MTFNIFMLNYAICMNISLYSIFIFIFAYMTYIYEFCLDSFLLSLYSDTIFIIIAIMF